jgi:hypothetical protein
LKEKHESISDLLGTIVPPSTVAGSSCTPLVHRIIEDILHIVVVSLLALGGIDEMG